MESKVTFQSFQDAHWPFTSYTPMFTTIVAYIIIIYTLKEYMKDRKKFDLTYLVAGHNFFLSSLSLIMFVGMMIELTGLFMRTKDVGTEFFCDINRNIANGPANYWMYIFYLSKYYELFDTIIIILKKRPLIFLHVYHHIITMVLVYVMMDMECPVRWLPMIANCAVHVPMYYYFGISALGMSVWWKKYITVTQITQFALDLIGNSIAFYYYLNNYNCASSISSVVFGQVVIFSFLVLFISFYKSTYSEAKSPSTSPTTSPRPVRSALRKED